MTFNVVFELLPELNTGSFEWHAVSESGALWDPAIAQAEGLVAFAAPARRTVQFEAADVEQAAAQAGEHPLSLFGLARILSIEPTAAAVAA